MPRPQTHRALQDASRVGTVENQRSKQSPRGWSLEQESIEFSSAVASSSACAIFRARACRFYVIRYYSAFETSGTQPFGEKSPRSAVTVASKLFRIVRLHIGAPVRCSAAFVRRHPYLLAHWSGWEILQRTRFHLRKKQDRSSHIIAATSFQLTIRSQHHQAAKDSRGPVAIGRQRQYNPYPVLDRY